MSFFPSEFDVFSAICLLGVDQSDDVSKAAVAHLTRGLALDLAPQHIIVNDLAPGVFPSRMTEWSISSSDETLRQETLFGRLGNEVDMVSLLVIFFLLLSYPNLDWIDAGGHHFVPLLQGFGPHCRQRGVH